MHTIRPLLIAALAVTLAAPLAAQRAARRVACDPDNAGLTLPPGFCALIVADTVGRARHLTVLGNGDVAVALDGANGGVLILADTNGDGRADVRRKFGPGGGTGIAHSADYLYFGMNRTIVRWPWPAGTLEPKGAPDTVVSGLPAGSQHAAKNIALGPGNALYVNIGAPSNACQERDRIAGSPGRDPCPLLDSAGGIWRFDGSRLHQTRADGHRFATGLRNTVALTVDQNGQVFGVVHGRDQLGEWSQYYDVSANAEKPAEEFDKIEDGGNYGWPYCYFDPDIRQKLLNPEYGGDGHTVGRCAQFRQPMLGFPAHWAPDGLLMYRSRGQFPRQYSSGAFVAFHGSWNRAPLPQQGYNVVFVPFANGAPSGEWSVFAEGFRGTSENNAEHRPCGIAEGPDGSIFVSDDRAGRIYRIMYRGQ